MDSRTLARWDEKVVYGGCWLWTAAVTNQGYGVLMVGYRVTYAHRLAYEHFVGPISEGLEIDHLCRNRACVNPAHLETVTATENKRRGVLARVTACPQGHPYDEKNTRWRTSTTGRWRYCLACQNERNRNRRGRHP